MASPFAVRSFRFQWPADLATSWAFEMEALILGWFVLSTTGSVQQLVSVAALGWLGSLFSPFFGILGDRVGHRTLLCATRGIYAVLAGVLTALTLSDSLRPWHVFAIAALAGLLRPSDNVMRQVLVGQTMRAGMLLPALGINRTTSDTARVAAAFTGAGGVALIGMGPAYALVTVMYVAAFFLSLGIAATHPSRGEEKHPLVDLKQGFSYVWHKPDLLGAASIAFLVNLLAYPFVLGLLPYVAREVYAVGPAGLGYLAASFSIGALVGSLLVGTSHFPLRAARVMLGAGTVWFAVTLLFGQTSTFGVALALLLVAGFAQSYCLMPLAAVMLRSSEAAMRGRVMGIRQLAVWGLPLGLVAAGPMIERLGYSTTNFIYAGLGLVAMLVIGYRWRHSLWHRAAAANVA